MRGSPSTPGSRSVPKYWCPSGRAVSNSRADARGPPRRALGRPSRQTIGGIAHQAAWRGWNNCALRGQDPEAVLAADEWAARPAGRRRLCSTAARRRIARSWDHGPGARVEQSADHFAGRRAVLVATHLRPQRVTRKHHEQGVHTEPSRRASPAHHGPSDRFGLIRRSAEPSRARSRQLPGPTAISLRPEPSTRMRLVATRLFLGMAQPTASGRHFQ